MAETIVIRVSARTMNALQRDETVPLRLSRTNVVGGVSWPTGRRPGRKARKQYWWQTGGLPSPGSQSSRLLLRVLAHGGKVTTRQAKNMLRRSRVHTGGVLSNLAAAGLLRREQLGRYVVTARGRAVRKVLGKVGRYRAGSDRARVLEWAQKRGRPFTIAEVGKSLRVERCSVSEALRRLLKDRVIVRKDIGVYRAR